VSTTEIAPVRDLADERHARRSQRAVTERRTRKFRRDRTHRGGRRAVLVASAMLALGAGGAMAQTTGSAMRESSSVAAAQAALGIPADGIAGAQTRRAVKRFQREHGLTVDGIIGPQTLAALGVQAKPASTSTSSSTSPSAQLEAIAQCESGGDPTAISPDGRYRGKYQFSRATWRSLGGTGDPAAAPESVQDELAAELMSTQGPNAWPVCSQQ
jgi:peptidoglycan hydrolase-like protein with peptidoglycan-binding domain